MALPSNVLAMLVRRLLLLGVSAQLWTFYRLRHDPPVAAGGGIGASLAGIVVYFSPILLAGGGALLAKALRQRGSGWALLAAGLPFVVLLPGIGVGVYLTLSPVSFD